MPEAIDYQRAPTEAEREATRRRKAARRDRRIRWLVIIITAAVFIASIFLYNFPARWIDINGYTG